MEDLERLSNLIDQFVARNKKLQTDYQALQESYLTICAENEQLEEKNKQATEKVRQIIARLSDKESNQENTQQQQMDILG